jgi:hypothetical protein
MEAGGRSWLLYFVGPGVFGGAGVPGGAGVFEHGKASCMAARISREEFLSLDSGCA